MKLGLKHLDPLIKVPETNGEVNGEEAAGSAAPKKTTMDLLREKYQARPLPCIIGTSVFHEDENLGMGEVGEHVARHETRESGMESDESEGGSDSDSVEDDSEDDMEEKRRSAAMHLHSSDSESESETDSDAETESSDNESEEADEEEGEARPAAKPASAKRRPAMPIFGGLGSDEEGEEEDEEKSEADSEESEDEEERPRPSARPQLRKVEKVEKPVAPPAPDNPLAAAAAKAAAIRKAHESDESDESEWGNSDDDVSEKAAKRKSTAKPRSSEEDGSVEDVRAQLSNMFGAGPPSKKNAPVADEGKRMHKVPDDIITTLVIMFAFVPFC